VEWTMFTTDDEVHKKKTIVLVISGIFVAVLVAMVPAHRTIERVVLGITPTSATAIVQAATETATPSLVVTQETTQTPASLTPTPTSLPPTATATVVPSPTATQEPTPTPLPPTPTSTAVPPTATPTPSPLPEATPTLTPTTEGPVSGDLLAPTFTLPVDGAEVQDPLIAVEGTAPARTTVVVYEGDVSLGEGTVDDDGHWQFNLLQPLSEGQHSLVARATDGERVSEPSNVVRIIVLGELLPITGGE
jgi:hypothetical protein